MFKKIILYIITMLLFIYNINAEVNNKVENLIVKLAEIDASIDEMIIKNEFNSQKVELSQIRKDIEDIFLNKTEINTNQAKMIWMYSGKIYIKIKKFISYKPNEFRLAPSDLNTNLSDITQDIKKIFATSKWIYISSKKSKR